MNNAYETRIRRFKINGNMFTVATKFYYDEDPDLSWLEDEAWNEATDDEPEGYGRRELERYGTDWWQIGVAVDVSIQRGVWIAETGDSLWGIHSETETAYLDSIVGDVRGEAFRSLRRAIAGASTAEAAR